VATATGRKTRGVIRKPAAKKEKCAVANRVCDNRIDKVITVGGGVRGAWTIKGHQRYLLSSRGGMKGKY